MDLSQYDFNLPDELIAKYPISPADQSKLLYLPEQSALSHHIFRELPKLLRSDDVLIFNRTGVSNRRLYLKRQNGGQVETVFLSEVDHPSIWRAMIRKAGRLKQDEILSLGDVLFQVKGRDDALVILEAVDSMQMLQPRWQSLTEAEQFFTAFGQPPIPPYLNRTAEDIDFQRYQTVYADAIKKSVAAPTAGLHFTPALLQEIEGQFDTGYVNLTIGYGTFAPLQEHNFNENSLHTEQFTIPEVTADLINTARHQKRRIVAVGTTTLRAIESVYRKENETIKPGSYSTDIFIYPPDTVKSCQALITNFHLPASSLFLLVCAFGQTKRLQDAYACAIASHYRFYSYGDAMLIEAP